MSIRRHALWVFFDAAQRSFFGHPVPPIIAKEDAAGVVAGTTSHFSRAFPQVKVELEGGQIVKVPAVQLTVMPGGICWKRAGELSIPVFLDPDYFISGKLPSAPIQRSQTQPHRTPFFRRI